MSATDDPFHFDNDQEFDRTWSARAVRPPETGSEWEPGGRATDVPITPGGEPSPFDEPADESEPANNPPPPGATIVEYALDYARRGWPVFPCKPTNKAPFLRGRLSPCDDRRGNDPQMVGLLAAGHDRRADGTAVRRLGG